MMISIKKLILLLIISGLSFVPAQGQQLILGPSTGTMDSKSVFSNPSVLSFQNAQIAFGVKGYHLGFFEDAGIGYKQGYLSILSPRLYGTMFGGGFNIQYFDSPVFSRSQSGASASYRVMNNLSVGVHGSLYHFSYNRDNFVGFDFNDPLFEGGYSKFTFNTTAGVYYRPLPEIEIAGGARNLNEPNISLVSDNVTEHREMFGGFSYRYRLLKGTFELVHGRYGMESYLHAELYSGRGFYARSGANMNFDNAYLEAQAHIGRGYSINYQFELPINEFAGNSSGSHMFSVVYEFNRIPSLPEKVTVAPSYPAFERPIPEPAITGDIFLNSQTDHVILYEKQIIRKVDEETVSMDDLAHLSEYDLGELGNDPRIDRTPYGETEQPTVPIPESVQFTSSISPQYSQAIDFILEKLGQREIESVDILAGDGSEMRAAGLRNELRSQSGNPITVSKIFLPDDTDTSRFTRPVHPDMLIDENIAEMEPAAARIQTINTYSGSIRSWDLQIMDESENPVHTIRGSSSLPGTIEWNWQLDNGEFIEPGVYSYILSWISADGSQYQSNLRNLYVQKILRKITIDITKDIQKILDDPDAIEIILKNN